MAMEEVVKRIMFKIGIASGKGGTGKTTLSTNIVSYLAENEKVLLADMDVEEPNSHIFIDSNDWKEEKAYKEVPVWNSDWCVRCGRCKKVCNFNAITLIGKDILIFPELCHSCAACVELCPQEAISFTNDEMGVIRTTTVGNLDFQEAILHIGQEQAVPLIKRSFEKIARESKCDLAIIDSPPGTSCPVVETIQSVDFVFLVTEPSPFGLNDLKIAIDTVKLLKKEFAIIINKDDGNENIIRELCKKNNYELLAAIPEKKDIASLYSVGSLIYKHDNDFLKQMKKIAKKIAQIRR